MARSGVPATLAECVDGVLNAAGLNRAAPAAKTMSTRVARPSTIAAGFMLTGRPTGGRGGAGGSVVVVDDSSMTGEPTTARGSDSFAGSTPAEVVDRPVAGAEAPAGGPGQGPVDESLGGPHGLQRFGAAGQAGRDGRRQAAPRAVVVAGGHPGRGQDDRLAAVDEDVGRSLAGEVSALHDDGPAAEGEQLLGRLDHPLDRGQVGRLAS